MTINELLTQDLQTELSVTIAFIILSLCFLVYRSDIKRQKDIEAWEAYRVRKALEDRGLGNKE